MVDKDPAKAEAALLKLPGLKKFVDRLQTEREKEDFRKHMRKYINMWLPDCPFEVSTTNRYTIVTHEAAATARRSIPKGETIKYLVGNLVAMTKQEEKDLDLTRRDFSIVMSSRKKTPSLFLGPARFANHDCDANARLMTKGSEGMQVVAVKDIRTDEEITVTYGEDYFGIENCECLCQTCENLGRNGWAKTENGADSVRSSTATPVLDEPETPDGPYSFRRKRKYVDSPRSSMTPEATESEPDRKKAKLLETAAPQMLAPPRRRRGRPKGSSLKQQVSVAESTETDANSSTLEISEPPPTVADVESNLLYQLGEEVSSKFRAALRGSPLGLSKIEAPELGKEHPTSGFPAITETIETPLPVSTPEKPPIMANVSASPPTPFTVKIEDMQSSSPSTKAESIFESDILQLCTPASTPSLSHETPSYSISNQISYVKPPYMWLPPGAPEMIKEDSPLSSLCSTPTLTSPVFADFPTKDVSTVDDPKPKRQYRRRSRLPPPPSRPEIPLVRRPGDYIRTPLLLSAAYSRWVDCKTCPNVWVQANGYLTRKECPRCERHSKLYGFRWPKTDNGGRGDNEERVMDHRTVHRFLPVDEEKGIRKRGRGVLREGERGESVGLLSSERSDSRERGNDSLAVEEKEPKRRRSARRGARRDEED